MVTASALLLDFGGVVIRTPFELAHRFESGAGLPPGALDLAGPFDPASDPDWVAVQAGDLAEGEYWRRKARQAGALLHQDLDLVVFLNRFFAGPEETFVRPQARRLVAEARAAGLGTGILTNDLANFHDASWLARVTILDEVDVLLDASVTGVAKPDRRAYAGAARALGCRSEEVVFVDDQPVNVRGARAAGMRALHLDVTDPAGGFRRVRQRLGLTVAGQPPGEPRDGSG